MGSADDTYATLPHEVIRSAPGVYLGGDASARELLATALRRLATSSPSERVVRLVVWGGHVFTLGWSGPPLPIEGVARFEGDLLHPSLYDLLMAPMVPGGSRRTVAAALVNALSERTLVATVHDGVCYRARFQRGCIASLLKREEPREIFGTSWLTFEPDPSVVPGHVGIAEARELVAAITREATAVELRLDDRRDDPADL